MNSVTIDGNNLFKHHRNGGVDVVRKLKWIITVKGRLEAMQKTLKVSDFTQILKPIWLYIYVYICALMIIITPSYPPPAI